MTKNQARMGSVKIRDTNKSVKDLNQLLAKAREDIDEGDADYDAMQEAVGVCVVSMDKASTMFKKYIREKLEDVHGSKGVRPGFGMQHGVPGWPDGEAAWRSRRN